MTHAAKVTVKGRKSKTGSAVNVLINGHATANITLLTNNEREIYQGINEYNCTFAHVTFNDADTASGTDRLNYEKKSVAGNNSGNNRNGYGKKTISSDYGECEIEVPCDRNSKFEPRVIEKR